MERLQVVIAPKQSHTETEPYRPARDGRPERTDASPTGSTGLGEPDGGPSAPNLSPLRNPQIEYRDWGRPESLFRTACETEKVSQGSGASGEMCGFGNGRGFVREAGTGAGWGCRSARR